MSDSLHPHELQHTRLPVLHISWSFLKFINNLSRWYYLTISSSATPFSLCLQSFTASGSFPMSRLFASGGQSIGASASASVFPMNIQDWFPLGWTGWISLSKGLSRAFSSTTVWKCPFFGAQPFLWSNSRIHTCLLEKNILLARQTFVGKVTSLLFNMLSKLSWLVFQAAGIF